MNQPAAPDQDVIGHAYSAAEALRAVTELTRGRPVPAILLTHLLGNLQCVARTLPQLFGQLGDGLQESLHVHDVFDREGDAEQNVINARAYLVEAAELAREIADQLEAAQSAIALQGHHVRSRDDTP